ncbi:MAG: class I SAM-dependent methyltransferase [Gaiellaceae bacterium]
MATSADRQAAELRQGTELAREDADAVWGWEGPAGVLRAERRAAFLIEQCGLGPGVRCLELGAGTGAFTSRLLLSGCDLVAIELSPDTAERCRARVAGQAEVVVGDVETGEALGGRTFDAIVGVSVLHHVDLDATFRSTFSRLRPGGRFAFSEPNIRNPQVWAERNVPWVGRRRHTLPHERAFTAGGLRRTFEGAGFVVDLAEPFEFLHPSTPQTLIPAVRGLERFLEGTPARIVAGSVRIAGRRAAAR